jgi:hypothetical protein
VKLAHDGQRQKLSELRAQQPQNFETVFDMIRLIPAEKIASINTRNSRAWTPAGRIRCG